MVMMQLLDWFKQATVWVKAARPRLVLWLLGVGILYPQLAYQALVNCFPIPPNYGPGACNLGHLLAIPARLFNWLIGFSVAVLFVIIIWAGVRMIIFYVSEAPETELQNAKLTLQRGLFGFLIVITAYLIVNTLLGILGLSGQGPVSQILQSFGLGN